MKKSIIILLACIIAGFAFVSCDGEKTPPVPLSEKYAGKIYNETSGQLYTDLQEAMDDSKESDCVLHVYKDIDNLTEGFFLNNKGYSMTIDLEGHTIDGTAIVVDGANTYYYGTFDLRGGNFTIKNGTVLGNANVTSSGVIRASNAASVTLENVNIASTVESGNFNYAMLINKTPVVINNTAENTVVGAIKVTKDSKASAPASVTIKGGNYTTFAENVNVDFVLETYAETCPKAIVIKGGLFDGYVKINSNVDQKQLDVDTTKYNVTPAAKADCFEITAK